MTKPPSILAILVRADESWCEQANAERAGTGYLCHLATVITPAVAEYTATQINRLQSERDTLAEANAHLTNQLSDAYRALQVHERAVLRAQHERDQIAQKWGRGKSA